MAKVANIYVRVKPEIKKQMEQVFDDFGMTISGL
jgi:antitoxin component of RelBE/YafQ-DinJ toxin-antitoxin module